MHLSNRHRIFYLLCSELIFSYPLFSLSWLHVWRIAIECIKNSIMKIVESAIIGRFDYSIYLWDSNYGNSKLINIHFFPSVKLITNCDHLNKRLY
jgi:hypothetical protein